MARIQALLLSFLSLVFLQVLASPAQTPLLLTSGNGSRASNQDVKSYLTDHNTVRAKHGAVALKWNNNLAAAAQKWADKCVFKHSGGTLGPYGENLAAGAPASGYHIANAVKSWADEAPQYNPKDPVPSHFTQMVWKATTEVGCAVNTCSNIFPTIPGGAAYYVCEYFPQGNVIGHFP
ncbi:CAP domain-containing protein [Mycena sanguinolenta]|nr:CAP domain-containing protein [Mycena sanguinolenta]